MNACELTTAISALANTIACGRTVDKISLLGAVFTQLGDTLLTVAAQKTLCGDEK